MSDYKKIEWNDYNRLPSKKGKYKVIYYSNGNIKSEKYFINGKCHRKDEPAYVQYYENGNIFYEEYLINGNSHKENGPAITSYYENGYIESERYHINDKLHKEDGPAFIWYHEDGNIDYEQYWLCDKEITKKDFYSPKIRAIFNIAKMMDTWESKLNFIGLSLNKEFNECL